MDPKRTYRPLEPGEFNFRSDAYIGVDSEGEILLPEGAESPDGQGLDALIAAVGGFLFRRAPEIGTKPNFQISRIKCHNRASEERPVAVILPGVLAGAVASTPALLFELGRSVRTALRTPFDIFIYSDDDSTGRPPNRVVAWLSWDRTIEFMESLSEALEEKVNYRLMPVDVDDGITLFYSLNDEKAPWSLSYAKAYKLIDNRVRMIMMLFTLFFISASIGLIAAFGKSVLLSGDAFLPNPNVLWFLKGVLGSFFVGVVALFVAAMVFWSLVKHNPVTDLARRR